MNTITNHKESKCELECHIVTAAEEIASLSKDWNDLGKRAQTAPAYFSRAWVQTFITEKHIKGKPLLVTVWADSKLVALLPLIICNYLGIKIAKVTPTTILCYTGILLDSEYPEAIHSLTEFLLNEKIANVYYNKHTSSHDEFTNKFFDELTHHGFFCESWKRHICLKAQLEPDFDQVLNKNRNHKQRAKILYHEKQIFKSGDVKVERFNGEQVTPEVIDRIADIQNDSWVRDEGKAVLAKPFYKKLLFELARADMGYTWILTNEHEDIAFIYGMRAHNRLYLKWMSYRQKYGYSTLSYGKAMYMQAIRDACNDGITEIDFGFGEDSWKQLWATDKDNVELVISGLGLPGTLIGLLCGLLLKFANYKWKLKRRIIDFRTALKKRQ